MAQAEVPSRTQKFSIEVANDSMSTTTARRHLAATGKIIIGQFSERFLVDLSFWAAEDYRRSWNDALVHLEDDVNSTSCLIVSITDPAITNYISCWPMYRDGEEVYLQNAIIILGDLDEPFNLREPWRHVEARSSVDEDGNRISEWHTSVSQLRQFREAAWG